MVALAACGPAIEVDETDGAATNSASATDASTTNDTTTTVTGTVSTGTVSVGVTTEFPPPGTTDAPPPLDCPGTGGPNADGLGCESNEDCASGVCNLFEDAPPTPTAVCIPTPLACETWITATVRDITTTTPLPGAELRVLKALDAITNPAGAAPVALTTSDRVGHVDVVTDLAVDAPFGIVGVVDAPAYYTSGTPLAAPDVNNRYTVGIDVHELWVVPEATLDAWTNELALDPNIDPDALPLGANGGTVGIVRDAFTGLPVAGASVIPPPDSFAQFRYPHSNGSLDAIATDSTGLFVGLGVSTTGEELTVVTPSGTQATATLSSAAGIVFVAAFDVQ
jgi:hypothetical protein